MVEFAEGNRGRPDSLGVTAAAGTNGLAAVGEAGSVRKWDWVRLVDRAWRGNVRPRGAIPVRFVD